MHTILCVLLLLDTVCTDFQSFEYERIRESNRRLIDMMIIIKDSSVRKLLHYGALVIPATSKYTCSVFSSNFGHYLHINASLKILMMMMMMMMMTMTKTTMTMMIMTMTVVVLVMIRVRNSAHLLSF